MIEVAQLVYGNIERAGPSNRGGYRTLRHTSALLSPVDTAGIERHLFLSPGATSCSKRVCFRLSEGRLALGEITPSPVQDAFGREGSYVAHVLVFERKQLPKVSQVIFRLLETYPFIRSSADVWRNAAGDEQEIEAAALEVPAPCQQLFDCRWDPQALAPILELCLTANREHLSAAPIVVIGDSTQVFSFLSLVAQLLPDRIVPTCTFDTCFLGGNRVLTPYRFYGLPTHAKRLPNQWIVDTRARTIQGDVGRGPDSVYVQWYRSRLRTTNGVKHVQCHRNAFYQLMRWAADRSEVVKPPVSLCSPLLRSAAPLLRRQAYDRLRRRLAERFPSDVVEIPLRQLRGDAFALLHAALAGLDAQEVLASIRRDALQREACRLSPASMQLIAQQSVAVGDWGMLALCGMWLRDAELMRQGVKNMDDVTYVESLPVLLRGTSDYAPLIDGRRIDRLCAAAEHLARSDGIHAGRWILALCQSGLAERVASFVTQLPAHSRREFENIQLSMGSTVRIPETVGEDLDRRSGQGVRRTLLTRLFARWGRWP
jgi:hypothetical protein